MLSYFRRDSAKMRKLMYAGLSCLAFLGGCSSLAGRFGEKLDSKAAFFNIDYHMSQQSQEEMKRAEAILTESASLEKKPAPTNSEFVVFYDKADSLDEKRDRNVHYSSVEQVVGSIENAFLDARTSSYDGPLKSVIQKAK